MPTFDPNADIFKLKFNNSILNFGTTSNFNLNTTNVFIVYKYDKFKNYVFDSYLLLALCLVL